MQFELLTFPCGFQHTINPDDDERNGEQLAHIEQHVSFPGFLHILGILDEEAEGEDQGQHQSEVKTGSHTGGVEGFCSRFGLLLALELGGGLVLGALLFLLL